MTGVKIMQKRKLELAVLIVATGLGLSACGGSSNVQPTVPDASNGGNTSADNSSTGGNDSTNGGTNTSGGSSTGGQNGPVIALDNTTPSKADGTAKLQVATKEVSGKPLKEFLVTADNSTTTRITLSRSDDSITGFANDIEVIKKGIRGKKSSVHNLLFNDKGEIKGVLFNPNGNVFFPEKFASFNYNYAKKDADLLLKKGEQGPKGDSSLAMFDPGYKLKDSAFDGYYTDKQGYFVLRDPATAGWNYQTFAYAKNTSAPSSSAKNLATRDVYQSFGSPTAQTNIPTTATAKYTGISTGTLITGGKGYSTTANVTVQADFAQKSLNFNTHATKIFEQNYANKTLGDAVEKPEFDLQGTLTYTDKNLFQGTVTNKDKSYSGTANGRFYGPNAEEIGGTFGVKKDNNNLYLGGFGAKK